MSKQSIRFVKSYPVLMSTPIWKNDAAFKLYHFLLYKANHEEQQWQETVLHPNELIISRQRASAQLQWSIHKYQRHLQMLEELGVIATQRVRMGTKIKITDFLSDCGSFISEDQAESTEAVIAPDGGYGCPSEEAMVTLYRGYESPTDGAAVALERGYDGYNTRAMTAPIIDIYKNNRDTDSVTFSSESPFHAPEDFRQLWLAYPACRRSHRDDAVRLFREALVHGATLESMLAALEADKRSMQWLADDGKYIPGIVRWLQKETWHDYLCTEPPKEDEEHWVSR